VGRQASPFHLKDNVRRLAAQLQGDPLEGVSRLRLDKLPNLCGAGKGDLQDFRQPLAQCTRNKLDYLTEHGKLEIFIEDISNASSDIV
jgi:hypothetical protein